MESSIENSQECSLKIDTIWSEADENLLIKEEIVSDLEQDCGASGQEDLGAGAEDQAENHLEDDWISNTNPDAPALSAWQPSKKKVKSRNQRTEINQKLSCLHDTKNFKIVKRRLRCGDCRSLVCPECCKVMIPNLQSHFLGSGVCSSGTYLCKLCSIIFHSLCALQAHIRIHTMDTPYVCPDCGLIYNNIYFLILHLLNKCYHVYKIVRFKCKQCPGVYFTPENFVQHIQEKHIHCVFRCLYCSSLFSNYDEFNYHMENIHQKQKVQYLNYFRCSLCSNMVIPRFMYQKHVAQHRENSEFYEVDYQCLCGETYSLIGAFRSHFSYCNKKGVLPPKWSFLQRKLRSQDVVHQENFQNKEVTIQTVPVYSSESDYKNLSSVRSDKNSSFNEEKNENGEVNTKCDDIETTAQSTNPEIDKKENKDSGKSEEKSSNNNKFINNGNINSTSSNKYKCDATQEEKSTLDKSDRPKISVISEATSKEYSEDTVKNSPNTSNNKNDEEIQNCKNGVTEPERTEGDMPKIYDHIPCDHLGYLTKTQCPEQHKTTCDEDDIIAERPYSPDNYRFVTELNEKTGVITTKTVPLNEFEIEDDDNINEDDDDTEGLNVNGTNKQFTGDKTKFKGNSSLSCPFCIVLFPKHNLTFQQFRLHLESYHPDAALNITVNNNETEPSDKIVNDLDSTVNNCQDLKESDESFPTVASPKTNPANREQECSQKKNKLNFNQDRKQNENTHAGSGTVSSKRSLDDWGDQPSKAVRTNDENISGRDGNPESWGSEDGRVETVSCNVELSCVNLDSYNTKNPNSMNCEKTGNDCTECYEELADNSKSIEKTPEKPNRLDSSGKTSPKTISDLDYEGETSKDSNWSGISGKDTRTNSPESKTEEKERSRRESEVWSEFYESLMLAEKLKKKKNPSPDSESKKKSVVSDYSSKRVVKKPKRYRESSESADSNEYSESDEDFMLENEFIDKIYSEEKTEDQPNKKQILLDKLEKVDGKFVDYLFDLVTKKEKLFDLYKKHSTLRANRYSHDLRSYRKKVLNGIKQRGRPLKILRYRELIKKKELGEDAKNQLKKKTDSSPENKGNEKRRGRPRKCHEAAKLKERRRSDKEVDFIEKNFEREENDMSPCKRKRKLSSKLQYYRKLSDDKEDFSSGQVITNKSTDSNKKFTCAVCKETFPGSGEFREHIVVHRMEENTYQCMECGECFVVRPSLEKHLHAFHKIKNIEKYITDNQCCSIKKEVVEVDNEPLKENQCKVCKDQFDRPIDLTKHFRIHGMAFLKEFRKDVKSADKRNV